MSTPTTIFTIGHGSDSFDAFLARLTPHGVTMVVDVRSHPVSRHAPEFDKRTLEEEAASAGLGYRWLGSSLGGRPDDPTLYDATGAVRWDAVAETAQFAGGITEVLGLARTSTLAIMCAELDPRRCHRSMVVAPHLVEVGYTVVDILADGGTAPYQPPLG